MYVFVGFRLNKVGYQYCIVGVQEKCDEQHVRKKQTINQEEFARFSADKTSFQVQQHGLPISSTGAISRKGKSHALMKMAINTVRKRAREKLQSRSSQPQGYLLLLSVGEIVSSRFWFIVQLSLLIV